MYQNILRNFVVKIESHVENFGLGAKSNKVRPIKFTVMICFFQVYLELSLIVVNC